jgi:DNA polymerase-4
MNLFEDSSEMIRLYQSLDIIRKRYGKHAIHSASAINPATKAQRHEENTKIFFKNLVP